MAINIDVTALLKEKYVIPLVLGVVCGLSCYEFRGQNIVVSIIVGLLAFLVVELAIWIWNVCQKRWHTHKLDKIKEQEDKDALNKLANKALVFFRTLGEMQREAVVALYRHPHQPQDRTRYIKVAKDDCWKYVGLVEQFASSEGIPFVWRDGWQTFNGNVVRIVFDPFFHELLENFVDNGVEEYPKGFDVLQFRNAYHRL